VLNALLTALAIAALPVILLVIIQAAKRPEQWFAALTFSALYLLLMPLAIFRRISYYLRAWILLSLGYVAGALALARGGLAGDGRVFLLVLPMMALILAGARSGLVAIALSLLIYAGFAVAAHTGLMEQWLVTQENTLALIDWAFGGAAFTLVLVGLMVLQWRLNRFLTNLAAEKGQLDQESERLRAFNENIVQSMNEGIVIEDTTGRFTFANPKDAELMATPLENLIGKHWEDFVSPEYMARVQDETEKRSQGVASRYEAEMLISEGQRIPIMVSARPLFDGERFTGVLTVLTDITELRQTEGALERRNREVALLHRASQAFGSTLDLDHVLFTVLEEARSLMSSIACSIWLLDPESDVLVCQQATGPKSEMVRGWRLAPGEGLGGWVVHHGESLIVPDAQIDDRYFREVDQEVGFGLRSILTIPLQVNRM
jgi:PAS domain S-box-containing protein